MKKYKLKVGEVEIELPGDFALWREDAGFQSEELLGSSLRSEKAGSQRILMDEEGITSIICVQADKS